MSPETLMRFRAWFPVSWVGLVFLGLWVPLARAERLELPNPGFEKGLDSEGSPLDWRFYSSDARLAEGSTWVLSGSFAAVVKERGLTAAFPIPQSGYFTVGCRVVGGQGGERVALQATSAKTPSGRSPVAAARVAASRHRLLQTAGSAVADLFSKVQVNVFTGAGEEVGCDDFFLLGNGLANSDFETGLAGWQGPGATWQTGSPNEPSRAVLPVGAGLRQEISAEPYGTSAFFFQARSPQGPTSFEIELIYQDPVGAELISERTTCDSGLDWRSYSLSILLPATATAGTVGVKNLGEHPLEATGFRHLALVTPVRRVSPNGDGFEDSLPISTWNDSGARGNLRLVSPGREPVEIALGDGVPRGLGEVLWNPGSLDGARWEAGSHRLRLEVEDPRLGLLAVEHPLEIHREPKAASEIPSFPKNLFVRGFWLVVHQCFRTEDPPATEQDVEREYDRLFEVVRMHHGNAALPAVLDHQYAPVRRAAERWGVLQVPSFFQPELLLRYADPFEELPLWIGLEEAVEDWRGSPMFLGAYPLDEPTPELFGRARQAACSIAALSGGKPSFFSLADTGVLKEFASKVRPPIISVHSYPFGVKDPLVDWDGTLRDLEKGALAAQEAGVPFWAVIPTFEEVQLHRFPSPQEFRLCAHLALVLGAKGLWCFVLNSSDIVSVHGMVDTDFQGGPLLEEAASVFETVENLETFLLDLRLAVDMAEVEGGFYARTLVSGDGRVHVGLANRDLERAQTVSIRSNDLSKGSSGLHLIYPEDRALASESGRNGWKTELEIAPAGLAFVRLEGVDGSRLPPPSIETEDIGSFLTGLKRKAREMALPDRGDFSWKQVGRIYPGER